MRFYLSRFEQLFEDHTIFGGVTYVDAHVTLTGMLVVCAALVLGRGDRRRQRHVGAAARAQACPGDSSGRGLLSRAFRWSAGTSAALSSNRTNWFASNPTLPTTLN